MFCFFFVFCRRSFSGFSCSSGSPELHESVRPVQPKAALAPGGGVAQWEDVLLEPGRARTPGGDDVLGGVRGVGGGGWDGVVLKDPPHCVWFMTWSS